MPNIFLSSAFEPKTLGESLNEYDHPFQILYLLLLN